MLALFISCVLLFYLPNRFVVDAEAPGVCMSMSFDDILRTLTEYRTQSSAILIEGCQITIQNSEHEPIIVDAASNEFVYPENDLTLEIAEGTVLRMGCPGGTLTYGNKTGTLIEATCESGSSFLVNGNTESLTSLYCSNYATQTARYTGETCEQNGKEIEIGFALDSENFARSIRICFDDEVKNPLYSQYTLTSKIGNQQNGVSRPNFAEDTFFNLNVKVDGLYEREVQRSTINELVGLSDSSTKYVSSENDYYLSRGHLTAKEDFVYANQQRSTFHLCNAPPQWQTVNGENWNTIEENVRTYAQKNDVDLIVYTGTFGISTLPHEETGETVELYFYTGGENNVIPIAELYWKLVYNPENGNNVAFLSINNPYQTDMGVICDDVSEKLTWVTWDKENIKKGYSYACAGTDLRKAIPYVPDLEFGDLLL